MPAGKKMIMRRLALLITILIANLGLLGQEHNRDPKFFIYLCFGQSNMEAGAKPEKQDSAAVDPRFQMLATVDNPKLNRTKGNWYVAEPPINRPENNMGPVDWFGRTMVANLPEDYRNRLMKSIIAFEIEVSKIENVFKLSQNRDEESFHEIR